MVFWGGQGARKGEGKENTIGMCAYCWNAVQIQNHIVYHVMVGVAMHHRGVATFLQQHKKRVEYRKSASAVGGIQLDSGGNMVDVDITNM